MSDPLRLVVLGLDERAQNLFRMFFRGPCQNQAVIVEQEKDAEAFLIDLDTQQGARLLAQQRENHPERVFIVLSVKDQAEIEGTVFVKKPAQAQSMTVAIEKARNLAKSAKPKAKTSLFGWATRKAKDSSPATAETKKPADAAPERRPSPPPRETPAKSDSPPAKKVEAPPGMKVVARPDQETTVHKVAMMLDEQGFKSYLGHRDDIDPNNIEQLASAFYDPKIYLQGHVQAAIKVAFARNEPVRMETAWKNIVILPQHGLIHIAADEAQVRAACGIPFRSIIGVDIDAAGSQQPVNIKPITNEAELEEILNSKDHLTRLDAFMWKIALLTSKGRLPKGVDINEGFVLKRWPGMTRLMLPPHAMRIAASLVQKPCSLFDAAHRMGVRQQYVFAFVSAAHALGLIEQQPLPSAVDMQSELEKPAAATQPERKSLFKKILSRLKLI